MNYQKLRLLSRAVAAFLNKEPEEATSVSIAKKLAYFLHSTDREFLSYLDKIRRMVMKKHNYLWTLASLLLFLILLVGCGGGSSGDEVQTEEESSSPNAIALTADPVEVVRNGPSLITATLGDEVNSKADREVFFELTLNPSGGTIESSDRRTDDTGRARAVYRAGTRGGIDVLRVMIPPHGDATVNIKVFDADPPRQSLTIKANPDDLTFDGISTITATLTDKDGPVPGVGGTFSFLANQSGARLSNIDRSTDPKGEISAHYRAGRRPGIDVVRVSFSPSISATVSITVKPAADLTILPKSLEPGTQHIPYNGLVTASGGRANYRFSIGAGSSLPPGINLGENGVVTGTPTRSGTFKFLVKVDDSVGNSKVESITLVINAVGAIDIEKSLPNATQFSPYNHLINVTGGIQPYRFSLVQGTLPPRISLSPEGVLSGTPSVSGTYNIVVQVTDSVGTTKKSNVKLVVTGASELKIETASLVNGLVGVQYNDLIVASGGRPPYAWNIPDGSTPPPGLSMNARGIVSGTPTVAGNYSFIVRVMDANGTTVDKRISIIIANQEQPQPTPQLEITTTSLVPGVTGQQYNDLMAATGGKTPYSWNIPDGSLFPPGLTMNARGIITGRPTQAGTFNFVVRVRDAEGTVVDKLVTIVVTDPA